MPNPKTEPVMTLVLALLTAGAGLLAAFGVHLTDAQVFAITQTVEALVALGFWVRSQVEPKAKRAARQVAQTPVTGAA